MQLITETHFFDLESIECDNSLTFLSPGQDFIQ